MVSQRFYVTFLGRNTETGKRGVGSVEVEVTGLGVPTRQEVKDRLEKQHPVKEVKILTFVQL
jgi:hypothetical protein